METSIWDQILTRIETKVNRHSYTTWFKPTAFVADGGQSITVRVPNTLFKDWLTKHYSVVLSEALAEVRRPDASLVFVSVPSRNWLFTVSSPVAVLFAAAPPSVNVPFGCSWRPFRARANPFIPADMTSSSATKRTMLPLLAAAGTQPIRSAPKHCAC